MDGIKSCFTHDDCVRSDLLLLLLLLVIVVVVVVYSSIPALDDASTRISFNWFRVRRAGTQLFYDRPVNSACVYIYMYRGTGLYWYVYNI